MNRAKGLREYYDNLKIVAEWEASKPEKVKKGKRSDSQFNNQRGQKDCRNQEKY